MLLGQLDIFVIGQAGMLDGIDARKNRVLDALRSVRVRGNLASRHVRLVGRNL